MSSLLEIQNVHFSYGDRTVLTSVSLRADAGEFIALVGVNGAGKSTLLDIISGYRVAACGSVRIVGSEREQWKLRRMAREVSHLPQSVHADLPFTAEQLVAMGRYPHTDRWFESEADHLRIQEAMERTSCWLYRSRPFATLSGGERQRVLLAACFAQDASILLLDEPSTFLDIEQQLHCFDLLRSEARGGKLCIAATHDLNLALTYCTRLIVLAEGTVAHDLSTAHARETSGWLELFSPRLGIATTPAGTPWVWYR